MKKLHDLFIGDYKISQTSGVNYNTYKWILDYNGKSIKGHNGVDWATPNGVTLLNPFPKGNDVVVSRVGYDPNNPKGYDKNGYGNYLRLWDKTQKCVVLYAHCQKISVKYGDKLYFQQAVALTDDTGWSTGPHTHVGFYEVDEIGNKLNRDNGFDGFLHILSGVVEWILLNPTKSGEPPVIDSPLKECLRQHSELVGLLDTKNKELDDIKRSYESLQSETAKRLAGKENECKQKISDFKEKIINFIKPL